MSATATSDTFRDALRFVLAREGGKVDDPEDSGGRTAFGITQKVYRAWKHNAAADVWDITQEEVAAIYRDRYWKPSLCDTLPRELAIVVFDCAVHHGQARASAWLNDAMWADTQPTAVAFAILTLRREFMKNLAEKRPKDQRFIKGWLNRVDALRKEIEL